MNLSQLAAWLMRAKIPEKLYRNLSLSKFPGFFFEIALEGNASKSSLFRKILRSDSYDQSAVGIFSVSGLIAHAVDCQKPLLGRGIYHIAPRAHTERVYASAVFTGVGHLIACRTKDFIFWFSVKILIDHGLGMFDPQSHCKCFWLHGKTSVLQHKKGIPCTVAHSQYTDLRRNLL